MTRKKTACVLVFRGRVRGIEAFDRNKGNTSEISRGFLKNGEREP